jgi:hypothetical protein
VAMATCFRGWTLAVQGLGAEGIAQMQQGLAAVRATGTALGIPRYLAGLAKAYGQVGEVDEGLHLLTEAFAIVDTTGGHTFTAELHRLHGELLLRQAVPSRTHPRPKLASSRLSTCPLPAGQSVGTARGHEPGTAVAAPGQVGRGAGIAGGDLWLVYRGL